MLFTDGLVEDSERTLDTGLAVVIAALRDSRSDDLEALADHVLERAVGLRHAEGHVDLAARGREGRLVRARPAPAP